MRTCLQGSECNLVSTRGEFISVRDTTYLSVCLTPPYPVSKRNPFLAPPIVSLESFCIARLIQFRAFSLSPALVSVSGFIRILV
jgi:hypothetical protein